MNHLTKRIPSVAFALLTVFCGVLFGAKSAASQTPPDFYADNYCTTPGMYDESCLSGAIAAAVAWVGGGGANPNIWLGVPSGSGPRTYRFTAEVTGIELNGFNFNVTSGGATIVFDANAFTCKGCTGGSFKNVAFVSSVTPTVVSCYRVYAGNMACPGIPATGGPPRYITLDLWGLDTGHIPTFTDTTILVNSPSLKRFLNENFDTGITYASHGPYKTPPYSSGVEISGLTGTYFHIDLFDVNNMNVHDNKVMGGRGTTSLFSMFDGSGRCGAICIRSAANPASENNFSNSNNLIYNNTITYAASDSIELTNGADNNIYNNNVSYGGESGIVTGVSAKFFDVRTKVTGNTSSFNTFDGFDLSSNYGHTDALSTYIDVEKNISHDNYHTGFYADGQHGTYIGNNAYNNGLNGMLLDVGSSVITANTGSQNNWGATGVPYTQAQLTVVSETAMVNAGNNTVTANNFYATRTIPPTLIPRPPSSGFPTTDIYSGIVVLNPAGNGPDTVGGNRTPGGMPLVINPACPVTVCLKPPAASLSPVVVQ